jgi:hypothetical protein
LVAHHLAAPQPGFTWRDAVELAMRDSDRMHARLTAKPA